MTGLQSRARTPDQWRQLKPLAIEAALETPWLIGDWLNAAEQLGLRDERTAALNTDRRFEATTTAEWMFVASRFPKSKRRRKAPWVFYSTVAELPFVDADRLLGLALSEEWTLAVLRKAVTDAKKPAPKKTGTKNVK